MKKHKFIPILLISIILGGCSVQKSTYYSNIPNPIKAQIEKKYNHSNAFFYQLGENDTFLLWYYDQSTVHWFSYINRKLSDKGTFESDNEAKGLSIYKTNELLLADLSKFEENCYYALDGEMFGYVITSGQPFPFSKEIIAITYISSTECFGKMVNENFIARDFLRIRDLNYKFTTQ